MATDTTSQQIEIMFKGLHKRSAADAIPPPGTLSKTLMSIVDRATSDTIKIDAATLGFFATAAVEMWHRSVHSFLISASLTKASPLWASISGYYSSHYSVRAFAHLLGYFQLHGKKRIVQVEIKGSQYFCSIIQKQGNDREHKFYWRVVKNNSRFSSDPFFTKNEEGQTRSDIYHRSKANYADHINQFPTFQALSDEYLKDRVEKIASIELSDAPIPKGDSYPDIESVQLIAYHRMIKFRKFVDAVLGSSNRFWKANRKPGWCPTFLDFQIVEPKFTSAYADAEISS